MPIYHCKNCGFTFKRQGEMDTCPDCGKKDVREALPVEVEQFKKNLSLGEKEKSRVCSERKVTFEEITEK